MAKISVHCRDCEEIIGDSFLEVHEWLDGMNKYFPFQIFSDYHRSFRHNSYGIAILRSKSFQHELAGRIHLLRDYYQILSRREYVDNNKEIIRKSNMILPYFNNLEKFDIQIPHLFQDVIGLVAKGMNNG